MMYHASSYGRSSIIKLASDQASDDPDLFDDPYHDMPGFDPFQYGWSPYMGLDDDGRPLFLDDL